MGTQSSPPLKCRARYWQ